METRAAAALLGISQYALRKLVSERAIPHIRLGSKILFRKAALEVFLNDLEAASIAPAESPAAIPTDPRA